MGPDRAIREAARRAPEVVGSSWLFAATCGAIVLWLALGPVFGFSDAWLVLPATATSIGAFLFVVVLQYSQNRDTRALQLKLDELIRGLGAARTQLVRLEEMSDEELAEMESEFSRLRDEALPSTQSARSEDG